ncbi:hypothetical protein N9X48_08320 [Luminiphilus sp.]|nr:hypothetical protein [Luminiphilus sp.]
MSVPENSVQVASASVSDADGDSVTLTLSGDDAVRFSIDQSTGALTFTTAPNFESPSDADSDNSYRVTVTVSDGTDQASQAVVVSVTDVNEAPVIATINSQVPATSGFTSVSVAEPETTAFSATVSDPDSDSIIYRITGVDASLFSISSEGVVTFNSPPDFEIPLDSDGDNIYAVTVVAADAQYSDSVPVQVTVTDAQEGISGTLIDGYLAGSTVFQDINNNGVADSGEPSTTTDVLGNFSLTLTSTSPDARIRVVNSGFDIGANETLGAMLDINPNTSGSFIMTPASTVAARMLSYQALLNATETEVIIADSLGLTLADLPDDSLFGYDPLVKLGSSDSEEASEARGVVAANQFLMASANVVGAASAYTAERSLAAMQTQLQSLVDADGLSGTVSLSISDYNPVKAVGHSAYMDAVAEELSIGKPPVDAIRLDYSGVQIVDYIDGAIANTHYLYPSASGGTLDLSVPAPLDLSNLYDLVGSTANGTAPAIRFTLNAIPEAGSSGRATVTTRIYDGTNATRDAGERVISTEAVIDWTSDGSTITLTAPVQDATVTLIDESGIGISRVFRNEDTDVMSFTESGPDTPATLELKLTSYISRNLEKVGLNPAGYFDADNYYLDVDISGLEMRDASNQTFTKVAGQFVLAENPDIYIYPMAGVIGEGNSTAKANFALSRSSTSDITATYTLASGTATQGADFDGNTGTLTFTAGENRATVAVQPVTDNLYDEGSETLIASVLSANGATAVSQTATVTLIDSKQLADNVTARGSVADTTVVNVNNALADWFVAYLGTTTPGISGITGSFADYLTNDQGVSDLNAWVSNYITDKTPAFAPLVTSFVDSLDSAIDSAVSTDSTGSDLAIAVTKVMTGTKYIDYSTILNGSYINDDGSLAVTEAALASGVASAITAASNLVADTIGDPLGNDTRTNFADAQILILTSGDDDESGTSGSDLIASLEGTDTVNGLAGNDKLLGGSGVDTLIGGSGNDHLYGFESDDTLTGGDDNDKLVGGLGNDTISGGSGDDEVQAQTGDDAITSGNGTDTLLGGLGNDSITIDGSGDKTVDGGPGTDTLSISYGSITSISDFSIDVSGDYTSLTDSDGNQILFKNIETLTIGGNSYVGVYDGTATTGDATLNTSGNYSDPIAWVPGGTLSQLNFGNNIISSAYYDDNNGAVYMYPYADSQGSHLSVRALNQLGYDDASALTIYGTPYNDLIAGQEMGSNSAPLTIYSYGGLDVIDISSHTGSDTVDAGEGNDIVHVNNSYSDDISIDGGAGVDWLIILASSNDVNYTINSSTTSNFENVRTSYGDDTLVGDSNDNVLVGWGGADNIRGGAGDDYIYGYVDENPQGVSDGADSLYGGAGDDTLAGGAGDDVLDGGTGRDVLSGEGGSSSGIDGASYSNGGSNGSDTFVTRAGDGSTDLAQADVIMDFEDGTDQIGLDGISFNDLTIAQGTGEYANDTIVSYGAEYLFIIKNVSAANITYLDVVSTAIDPVTITGTSSDEVSLGGSGDDTISSGTGTDILVGYSGNDSITIDGSGDKTVDGGPGTDTLSISYGSITSISDFSIDVSGDYTSLTDSDGNQILFKNIETLTIGGNSYVGVYDGTATTGDATLNTSGNYSDPIAWVPGGTLSQLNFGNNIISSAYYDDNNGAVYMYPYADSQGSHLSVRALNQLGYDDASALTIYGTPYNDLIAGQEMGSNSAPLTIYSYGGLDVIDISSHTGSDTVDAGEGNDIVHVNNSYSDDISIDGGAGVDWLIILASSNDVNYTINSSTTSNFENVRTSYGDDTLVGDSNDNVLVGWGGADNIRGGAGDDYIYGYVDENPQGVSDGADSLYGGAGDDTLAGGAGDDVLDGGTGRDVLSGEGGSSSGIDGASYSNGGSNGSDTFVTRAGDGSTDLAQADVIMDFEDGTDQIGLDGISFNDLTIAQGTGEYANDTIVSYGAEYLFIIKNVSAANITDLDFTPF